MKRFKFNDWQDLAVRKDIKQIEKKLETQESVFFSLCWEIVLAVGIVLIDHLFDTETVGIGVWIAVAVLAILPPVILLICKFISFIERARKINKRHHSSKYFIDLFDNEICYWVMMSDSYRHQLSDLKDQDDEEKLFIFTEGCYYNNKAITTLDRMRPAIERVFYDSASNNDGKGKVEIRRLINILQIINKNRLKLQEGFCEGTDAIEWQCTINNNCMMVLKEFATDVKGCFSQYATQFDKIIQQIDEVQTAQHP